MFYVASIIRDINYLNLSVGELTSYNSSERSQIQGSPRKGTLPGGQWRNQPSVTREAASGGVQCGRRLLWHDFYICDVTCARSKFFLSGSLCLCLINTGVGMNIWCKIGWLSRLLGFICQGVKLKLNSIFTRQPMESFPSTIVTLASRQRGGMRDVIRHTRMFCILWSLLSSVLVSRHSSSQDGFQPMHLLRL